MIAKEKNNTEYFKEKRNIHWILLIYLIDS